MDPANLSRKVSRGKILKIQGSRKRDWRVVVFFSRNESTLYMCVCLLFFPKGRECWVDTLLSTGCSWFSLVRGHLSTESRFISTWGSSTDLLVLHHLPEHSPLADIFGPLSQPPAQTDLPTPAQATMKKWSDRCSGRLLQQHVILPGRLSSIWEHRIWVYLKLAFTSNAWKKVETIFSQMVISWWFKHRKKGKK